MATFTLKSTLNHYLQRADLTEADRAHLKRWLEDVCDPAWVKLAAYIRRCGELPRVCRGSLLHFH